MEMEKKRIIDEQCTEQSDMSLPDAVMIRRKKGQATAPPFLNSTFY